jgi:hypothetical protein
VKRSNTLLVCGILAAFLSIILVCSCVIIGASAWSFFRLASTSIAETALPPLWTSTPVIPATPSPSPQIIRPTLTLPSNSPVETGTPGTPVEAPYTPADTLRIFEETIVPVNDPIELAERLEGKSNLPIQLDTPPLVYQIGAKQTFWVTDTDTNENYQVQATLRYMTNHAYFWVEAGVSYNQGEIKRLVDAFESRIYPTNREFFGSEWTPGVDNDPRLYILYAKRLGGSVAGYFSSADEYLPPVREYTNAHEMFLLSAEHVDLAEEFSYGVLAHEFQHMIHWYRDRNEEYWLNEGFSELASFINQYDPGGADRLFVRDPDIQLNHWPIIPSERGAHYGAAFLFTTYFLDRFGEQATKALVADSANGMVSIDNILTSMGITDPLTGQTVRADDVFVDWSVANYLQDESVTDGRFTYHNYPGAPKPSYTENLRDCPIGNNVRDVSQYGTDYIRITCAGDYTLHFEGSVQVNALPVDSFSGSFAFYSNSSDDSDMLLTHTFDFTDHSGPLTFTYWTWYDLEKDYDYLYLEAKEETGIDGIEHPWQILITPSGTAEDPSGNSYGWGYNGLSGGGPEWIQESVDISQFAGKKVQLRFEYITDGAVYGEGFLLDDIAIPEIGYSTDFEADNGGWETQGWVRIQNALPQIFRLTVIRLGKTTTVETIAVSADNVADIPLEIGGDVDEIIIVVSGTARFTRQRAAYQFTIQP